MPRAAPARRTSRSWLHPDTERGVSSAVRWAMTWRRCRRRSSSPLSRGERNGNVPSSTVKDGQQTFVTPEGEHPITAGIGPFHLVDETYKRMWISTRVRPLLTTDNPNSDRYPAWIGPCATSRVVAIQLGH